jgi:hypothetical protein
MILGHPELFYLPGTVRSTLFAYIFCGPELHFNAKRERLLALFFNF